MRAVPFLVLLALLALPGEAGAKPIVLNDDCVFAGGFDCDASCAAAAAACKARDGLDCTAATSCTAECVVAAGVMLCDDTVRLYGDLDAVIAYAQMNDLEIEVPQQMDNSSGVGGKGCSVAASGGEPALGAAVLLLVLLGVAQAGRSCRHRRA